MNANVTFEDYLRSECGCGANTVSAYLSDLSQFDRLLQEKGRPGVFEARFTHRHVTDALVQFLDVAKSTASLLRFLSALNSLVDFQIREGLRKDHPLELIQRPRLFRSLPDVLTEEEVETLFSAMDPVTLPGLRDRALFELLYGAGLRVSEVLSLQLSGFYARECLLRVDGKGGKQRLVPLQPAAVEWVERYLAHVRPLWQTRSRKAVNTLFLGRQGKGLTRQAVWKSLQGYTLKAGLVKHLYPHIFRHSIATHLLQRGADLRSVQAFLGHSQVSSTQIYTHVSPTQLRRVYDKHHPRA